MIFPLISTGLRGGSRFTASFVVFLLGSLVPDAYVPYLSFAAFFGVSALGLVAGSIARAKKWTDEERSKLIHLLTLTVFWSPISLLVFWSQEINIQLLVILLINPLVMLAGAFLGITLGKVFKWDRKTTGVMILCCALSNQGFTLGAFACYAVIGTDQALEIGVAYVLSMMFFMVPIFYPIASAYGECEGEKLSKLMYNSFVSIRTMPLYAAIAGTVLNLLATHVEGLSFMGSPKQFLDDYHVWDVMLYLGAIMAYLGIGMRLRMGDTFTHWKLHLSLAGVKFICLPVATLSAFIAASYLMSGSGALGLTWPGFQDIHAQVLYIEGFSAMAINAVIACNLFGLDARLASSLWLVNTLLYALLAFPFFAMTAGLISANGLMFF